VSLLTTFEKEKNMKKSRLLAASLLLAASFGVAVAAETGTKIGERMGDGTVYAGVVDKTHKLLYTTAADAPGTYNWDNAKAYCAASGESGHKDWRVPTKGELNVLFRNRAAIGGFETGAPPAGWYRSSLQNGNDGGAWAQRFSDGIHDSLDPGEALSLRCVR
jgi:Protein of unknown function (DUF1566)